MIPRVLGRPTSINVRKVLWTLEEVGLAYDHEPGWATPDQPTTDPAFLALNPNALVPVLIDDAGVLWESNAICRYLANLRGRDDLLPSEARARAEVEMWMDWQATELSRVWTYAFLSRVRKQPGFDDPGKAEKSFVRWSGVMRILEDQLARTGAYAAGPTFTLADIVLGLSAHRYAATPGERAPLPNLDAWMTRLAERPAFRRWTRPETP